MNKPTYYLWKNDFPTEEAFKNAKEKYRTLGFRVVTFQDGPQNHEILEGIRAMLQNHSNGSTPLVTKRK